MYNKDKTRLIRVPVNSIELEIPSTVKQIAGGAFVSNWNMPTVTIPNSVEFIGSRAFWYCGSLKNITIPTSVTRIEDETFRGCESLTSIELPNTLKYIGPYAFAECNNLQDINLPNTEKAIELGDNALIINSNPDHLIIATIHTPMALLDDYALNPVLKQNFEAGKIVAKVTPVNKYFTFSSGVDVVLPEGVEAYKAMIVSDTQVGINKLTDTELNVGDQRIVKANNGVLLLGTAGKAYDIVAVSGTKVSGDDIVTTDAKSYGEDNQLEPVIESAKFDAASYYVLSSNQFIAIDATSENKVPACKAVLKKPAGVAATRSLTIGDGNTTGINETVNEVENNTWYNLQGSRVQTPTKKGVFIKNHKKVMVK